MMASSSDANNFSDSSINLDGILQNSSLETSFLNTEITLLSEAPERKKTVEESKCKPESMDEVMTLEDFLVQAGAVDESHIGGEVKVETGMERLGARVFPFDSPVHLGCSGSGISLDGIMGYEGGVQLIGDSGRVVTGKRRVGMLEPSIDKAAQQRQRRMIKNRESAARSRERKQAYQVELETMAVRLEEENEMLLKEKAERTKERFKQFIAPN